jgi:hypothetical protein
MPSAGPHAPGALQSTGGGHFVASQAHLPGASSTHSLQPGFIGAGPQSHFGGGGGGHPLKTHPHFEGPGPGVGFPAGSALSAPAHGGGVVGSIGKHTGELVEPSQHFTTLIGIGPQSHAGGGGGQSLISQWHFGDDFDLMQRPVFPPTDPSGQISVGASRPGPHSSFPQRDTRSADALSVPSSPTPFVLPEQAKMVAPNAAKKQNVRIFMVGFLRRHHLMEAGHRTDHEIV